jgi:hypothetical protein
MEIDVAIATDSIADQLRVIRTKGAARDGNQIERLQKRWYASLSGGVPDYTVYSDPYYVCDLWTCWILYSSKAVKAIQNPKALDGYRSLADVLGPVHSVVDLGCGFGFTTAALAEMFPAARVVGTNLPGWQYEVCHTVAESRFEMVPSSTGIKHVDLMVASEYFEHIENSLEHAEEVLTDNRPRMLIVANGYNSYSIGHFKKFSYRARWYSAKETSLNFNKMMRRLGYRKLVTKIWNNRPAIWIRLVRRARRYFFCEAAICL